jgi:hypothetical protein
MNAARHHFFAVPLSPRINIGYSCRLTFSIILYTRCILEETPINPPKPAGSQLLAQQAVFLL